MTRRRMRTGGTVHAGAVALFATLAIATAAPMAAQTVAITNAEIHTVSGGVIQGGTIVLNGGRIAAVGTSVPIPGDARIIDGTGKVVTPGLIDPASGIGLSEIPLGAPGASDAATTESGLGASFNPIWAVNPDNTRIPITRLRGVTASVVQPGGGNLFTGQSAVIALDGQSVDAMLRRESAAIYTAMGEAGSGRAGGSRAANYRRLHDALWDARAKIRSDAREDDEDAPDDPLAEGGRSGLNDRDLEALGAVISGRVPLVVTANRASDLRLALKLKDEFDIRMVIAGAAEGWRVAAELAQAGVPVIADATGNLPTMDGLGATLRNAGLMQAAGVEVLLGGGRAMTHNAGLAVANGMDHAAALRAVTLGPAITFGVADQMGSLEEGKHADLVVWSGDPFELSTSAEHVFIGGREIPDDSRQERLFERYRDLGRYRTIRR